MSEAVYKIIELSGTSKTSIEAAVQNAISRAQETIRNLRWFEVMETRGFIENERVSYWQVNLKLGFNVDSQHEVKEQGAAVKEKTTQKTPAAPQAPSSQSPRYRCKVCGYIYDPQKGDPTQEIKPGTAFADLPDSWRCPECGVEKEQFEKI